MHNYLPTRLLLLGFITVLLTGMVATSCNKKDDDDGLTPEDTYVSTESLAVTAFSLTADARVMSNLDSVFFSIDLEHGVIFNADSLPKGTNITKLIPKITYPSSVTSATIEMTGGTHREGTVNYYKNANDTIDFTGNVTLTLGAENKDITKTYTLKVNVHLQDPDTIYWDRMATIDLPSRFADPVGQKTVAFGNSVLSLIEENDGTYTLAQASDIFSGSWSKQAISPGFTPKIRTLTSSDNALYLIGDNSRLYTSTDGVSWTETGEGWQEIIGFYNTVLLGTSTTAGGLEIISYPESSYTGMKLPADFPVTGFTEAIEFNNRWTPEPTIILFGGYPFAADGKSPSWAFDGTNWVNIAENALPALTGLSIMPYYSYLNSASNGLLKEFEVYLAFGGMDRDNNINNTIFVSYDHGINWQRAQNYMQLPETILAGYQVDALPIGHSMESNLSNRWKAFSAKRRLPFEINGDIIKWECPYIFLFGGYDATFTLNSKIRSGVLQRLTFEPLF